MMKQESSQKPGWIWWINKVLVVVLVFSLSIWTAGTIAKRNLLEKYPAPGQLLSFDIKMSGECRL